MVELIAFLNYYARKDEPIAVSKILTHHEGHDEIYILGVHIIRVSTLTEEMECDVEGVTSFELSKDTFQLFVMNSASVSDIQIDSMMVKFRL